MHRIARIASASAIALCLSTTAGRAQLLTWDPITYLKIVAQLEVLQQQYIVLKNSYTQLQYTVASLQHLNPQSLETAPGLLSNAMRLPGSAAAEMPSLNFGSNLSGYGQQFYDRNHYYAPEGDDFAAQEMQRRQYATANLQGEVQAGIERATERLASLQQLEAAIPEQPDVQAVSAMNARINSEHMFLANEQANMQRLALLERTQERVDRQRAEQHGRKEAEDWASAVAGQAWGN